MRPLSEAFDVSLDDFRAIREGAEPVVLKGLVNDWPLVSADRAGVGPALLRSLADDRPVRFIRAEPEAGGRLHYGATVGGTNFVTREASLGAFLDAVEEAARQARPPALAVQGMPAPERLPRFAAGHRLPLLPPRIPGRLWIGNAAKVAIHHDPSENIACVAAGRRRFTLFPPEAVGDLYMGPFDDSPGGVQVSLVHLTEPDFQAFPRFRRALESAREAVLEPGDAIYIPYHWYHHVEATEPFNVLVNYWWDPAPRGLGSPWDVMLHGLIALRTLPPEQRRAWRAMFDHYVFQLDGDPAAHLPETRRGPLSPPTAEGLARMRAALKARLR